MIKINNLTKHYKGSTKGVNNLNLHIEAGDIYAFVGHNGAGKTTAIKCIVGIHNFNEGEIFIDNISVKTNPLECKQKFSYIPDNPDLYGYLTGIQYLNFIANIFDVDDETRTTLIKKYADEFEITDSLGNLISSYSHGMKQKIAIIAALVHNPKVLIMDEPFVGLDPKATLILKNIMKDICSKGGAIFFSTHVLDVAERICNKVAIIKNGKIVASGKMDELINPGASLEDVFMEVVKDA